ncbi:MAG: PBSX family phage terminase large subunit [Proteobacteria bacterium]|nr:PBSX family phage terminase large subunit [Pseudomonadota bacterium]NBP16406.1 PBSX family phage terminase large subunit [bacterium]
MTTLEIKTPKWAECYFKPSRYKVAEGGRASGKSVFFAELAIETMLTEPDESLACIRETQRSLEYSVYRLLKETIEKFNVEDYFIEQNAVVKKRHGKGVIVFQGMNNSSAGAIKSLQGFKYAWVEEAEFFSQRSLDLLLPTISPLRVKGAEIWFTYNRRLKTDAVDNMFFGDNPVDKSEFIHTHTTYLDNPFIPQSEKDKINEFRQKDYDAWSWIYDGNYLNKSKQQVFRNWKIEEFEAPADAIFYLGADWGYKTDPTVLVRCYIVGRKLYIDYEAYRVGCEIVDIPNFFMSVPEAEKWNMTADSARPETISHLEKNGFKRIRPAVKGARSVEEGVAWLQSFEIIVHPRCKHTIDELSLYSYKTDRLTGEIVPLLEDKNNHVIDALRYACEGARRAKKHININQSQYALGAGQVY